MGILYKNSIWRIVSLNTEIDEISQEDVTVSLVYDFDDSQEIFGDLNDEEINDITENFIDRVSKDREYNSDKKDSIIENVFKKCDRK